MFLLFLLGGDFQNFMLVCWGCSSGVAKTDQFHEIHESFIHFQMSQLPYKHSKHAPIETVFFFAGSRISIYWPQNLSLHTLDTPKFWHYGRVHLFNKFYPLHTLPHKCLLVFTFPGVLKTTHFCSPSFVALLQPTLYNHDSQQMNKSLQLGIKFPQKIHIFWCFKVLGYLSVHTTIQKFMKLKFWRPKNWFLS